MCENEYFSNQFVVTELAKLANGSRSLNRNSGTNGFQKLRNLVLMNPGIRKIGISEKSGTKELRIKTRRNAGQCSFRRTTDLYWPVY